MTSQVEVRPNPDIARWNNKYQRRPEHQSETVTPGAEAELAANLDLLPPGGLALEAACGRGAQALYLASLGFDVFACDGAIRGLEICMRSAEQQGLNVFPFACDLAKPCLPENAFNLVSVVRYLEYAAFDQLGNSVKPGGILFYKTFNTRYLAHNQKFRRSYVVEPGELNRSFSGFEILDSDLNGSDSGDDHMSYIFARKLHESKV